MRPSNAFARAGGSGPWRLWMGSRSCLLSEARFRRTSYSGRRTVEWKSRVPARSSSRPTKLRHDAQIRIPEDAFCSRAHGPHCLRNSGDRSIQYNDQAWSGDLSLLQENVCVRNKSISGKPTAKKPAGTQSIRTPGRGPLLQPLNAPRRLHTSPSRSSLSGLLVWGSLWIARPSSPGRRERVEGFVSSDRG